MIIPKKGQIWRRRYDGQLFVIIMEGKPTDYSLGYPRFRNILLVKIGKRGKILKTNEQNTVGANVEKFHDRYSYVGEYNEMERDFRWL